MSGELKVCEKKSGLRIAMIGAGYVGLTSGACLAAIGHQVVCCDINRERLKVLEAGGVPFFEPGLSEMTTRQIAAGRLTFSSAPEEAARDADAVFIAVGTPSGADGSIDLRYVMAAAEAIAPVLRSGATVVLKSTVVAGTAARVRDVIARVRGCSDVYVGSNPEFLREGSAIDDFMNADRVIVGADEPAAMSLLASIYAPLAERGIPVVGTATVNAELIKYAANAFLALKIGFINDVANLCEKAGADVRDVAGGIGLDARIGNRFLEAGPGFGGSCFPKDTRAFASLGAHFGAPQPLIDALIKQNDTRKASLARRIIDKTPTGGRVAVLGATFKANTDDVRESPALEIIQHLVKAGLDVHVHDPKPELAIAAIKGVEWHFDPIDAARSADTVAILTEWQEYREIDLNALADAMWGVALFDYRNLIQPQAANAAGLDLYPIGRPEAVRPRPVAGSGAGWTESLAALPER